MDLEQTTVGRLVKHRTERGSAGSTASTDVSVDFDPALPRSVLCLFGDVLSAREHFAVNALGVARHPRQRVTLTRRKLCVAAEARTLAWIVE